MNNNELLWLRLVSPVLALTWLFLVLRPARRSALMPPWRSRAVPWTGHEILGLLLVVHFLIPGLFELLFQGLGLSAWLTGAEAPAEKGGLAPTRLTYWRTVLQAPLQVASLLLILYLASGTRPYQLGITRNHLPRNLLLGFLTALCISPLTLTVAEGVGQMWQWLEQVPEQHPITEAAAKHSFHPADWVVIGLAVLVVAPLLEELLFRGVLQRWFVTRRHGGRIALVAAFGLALVMRSTRLAEGWESQGLAGVWPNLIPAGFVLLLAPGVPLLDRWTGSPVAGGIYGTAVLFGAAHSFAWPSPIPLFVLGLGLGLAAHRTQSLVPAILAHSLFNLIGFVVLLLGSSTHAG